MNLYAVITNVDTADSLNPVYTFQLGVDRGQAGEVSITDNISLAHAIFLERALPQDATVYRKMIEAICHYEPSTLVGTEF